MSEKLFVYGTLKIPKVQKRVIGRIVEGISDVLEGYKKSAIEIGGKIYPNLNLAADRKGAIKGLVLTLTKEELKKTDEYETSAYKRLKVTLKSGQTAWVYIGR